MQPNSQADVVKSDYLGRLLQAAGLTVFPSGGRIYHYTDGEGLIGILRTKNLRAGHVAFLNDTTELTFGKTRVHEAMQALTGEHDALLRRTLEVVWGRYEGQEIFVASFCEEPDLVPQWRGYGGAGSGYALGFDARKVASDGRALFGPVIYGHDAVTKAANAVVEDARSSLRALGKPTEAAVGDILTSLAVALLMLAVCSKDAVFSYEREYRLIYIVTRDEKGTLEAPNPIQFRTRSGTVVPFSGLPLPTTSAGALALESVWIGPTQGDRAARRGVELLLESNGLGAVPIHASAAPVRFL